MKKKLLKIAFLTAGITLCISPAASFAEENRTLPEEAPAAEALTERNDPAEETEPGEQAEEEESIPDISLEEEADSSINESAGEEPHETDPVEEVPVRAVFRTDAHVKYMDGSSDGLFYPQGGLSRAEAAKILYSLLNHSDEAAVREYVPFSDVEQNAWYAGYVKTMYEYGIISGYEDGTFRPDNKVTRAQFVKMIRPFVKTGAEETDLYMFSDVSETFWAAEPIAAVSAQGVIRGFEDGTFRPDDTVTRCQAAVILNRMLGRQADESVIYDYCKVRMYPDLSTDFWAYADIMEASVPHEYTADHRESWTSYIKEPTRMTAGYHVVNGALYYVDAQTGEFARSCSVDNHYFAYDGKYTTGNAHLDDMVRSVTRMATSAQMSQHQMLRAIFDYEVKNNVYLKQDLLEVGQTGWEEAYAVPFFERGKGNCYSFAAAFYYLAKNIGYDPKAVSGLVGSNRRPHGWVEIQLDGTVYIYDTELTMAKRKAGYSSIDLFEMTYKNAVYIYAKS